MENIIASKLYRPGSVGLVTRSGGLFNELARRRQISRSDSLDHILRFEEDSRVKFIVMLGEIGGDISPPQLSTQSLALS